MKPNSNQMNKLGQRIFRAFAAGSVEELAAALEVIVRENSASVDCGALPKTGSGSGVRSRNLPLGWCLVREAGSEIRI
jgi:hypothetical protein